MIQQVQMQIMLEGQHFIVFMIKKQVKRVYDKTTIIDKELFDNTLSSYYMGIHDRQYNYGLNLLFKRIDLLETFNI